MIDGVPRNRKVPAIPPEGLSDVEQACLMFDVSRATLYRYMKESDFPEIIKFQGRTWFRTASLEAWLKARMAGVSASAGN